MINQIIQQLQANIILYGTINSIILMQKDMYGKIENLQDSFSWIKQIIITCFF